MSQDLEQVPDSEELRRKVTRRLYWLGGIWLGLAAMWAVPTMLPYLASMISRSSLASVWELLFLVIDVFVIPGVGVDVIFEARKIRSTLWTVLGGIAMLLAMCPCVWYVVYAIRYFDVG